MSQIETLSQPQAFSMADEWFQFATADHFWMQSRHRLIVRNLGPYPDAVECRMLVLPYVPVLGAEALRRCFFARRDRTHSG